MHPLLFPFLSYSVLMIFSPGPSNISASTLGEKVGYRKSIAYMVGMCGGFFIVLLLAGLLADVLKANYGLISTYLKWVGAAYITWLAISLFVHARQKESEKPIRMGFVSGFLLVLLNPKGILFAITTFASFTDLVAGSSQKVVLLSGFLAALSFASTSAWAITGSALSKLFGNRLFSMAFSLVMALFLLYSAYSIVMH